MKRPRKILSSTVLVVLSVLAAWIVYHETRVPQNQTEVLNRMIELTKEGRYDKAIQIVDRWLTNGRRDSSKDDLLFQQIAIVYFVKAAKKPASREDSLREAERNLEKALEVVEKRNPEEIDIGLFDVGAGYEEIENLATNGRCRYYEKARDCYIRQLPMIKGESYTAYGKTFQLEPLRREIKKHLDATETKLLQNGCRPSPGTQEK